MHHDDTAVAQLQRWQQAGGRWRVLNHSDDTVVIALLTCDTGEEVERMSSASSALLAYLGERDSSEDEPVEDRSARRTPPVARDRDTTGRPRNARPRDALGRPLRPGIPGVPTMPDDLDLTPADTLRQAQRLLDDDRPFHAHEVLEAAWKAARADERELWRGLAQLAVGLTHARRGNTTGAARLLQRSADRISPYEDHAPHGIAVGPLSAWARAEAARITTDRPGDSATMPPLTT